MSSYGLSSETKKEVKSTVLALRNLLEGAFDPDTGEPVPPGGDVVRQIARYGISIDKPESFQSENAPKYLTDEEKKKRERICAAIKREVAIFGELSDKTALKRGMRAFIRQTSYTWINRLLGLRCMEARGLLKDDRGELDFVVTPSDDYGGLPRRAWRIKGKDPARWQTAKLYDLQCEAIADACRQLTQEIKVLFDPEHDYGLIWPSATALNTLLQKIQELDKVATPSPFTSPDFLGWVYQYFQTKEKKLVFKAVSNQKQKIEKDDIIAATQIYTEHYMVEYLVQNTLGRFWMEMHPDSKLSAKWAYSVKPPEENPPVERELQKAIEIKLMDPAVGSGHFHLIAFDLLLAMYEEEIENAGKAGWSDTPSVEDKKDIPASILEHNLFGIDIDARSIQLASLVLVMKARESGYEGSINHLNLVVANSAPFESEAWFQFIQNLEKEGKHSVARVLAALGLQLKNLDEFGSLLRIEDEMQKIIQEEKKQWIAQAKMGPEQDYLFPEMSKPRQEKLPFEIAITDETFFDRLGSVIHKELDTFYLRARQDGLAEEAIMAADAERGFDFVRLSMQRYDGVYTNPPYLGKNKLTERLRNNLGQCFKESGGDLYSLFIRRGCELMNKSGYLGMVTMHGFMFIPEFLSLRDYLMEETHLIAVAHLGNYAFEEMGDHAPAVLFCLKHHDKSSPRIGQYIRAVHERDKVSYLQAPKRTFTCDQEAFRSINGNPFIYWISDKLRSLFHGSPLSLKGRPVVGLQTGDIPRFIRSFWEVNTYKRWHGYYKGGDSTRFAGIYSDVIDWADTAQTIYHESSSSRWQGVDFFESEGLAYLLSGSSFSARQLPADLYFDVSGPSIFFQDKVDINTVLGILNSNLILYFLYCLNPTMHFLVSDLKRLPIRLDQKRELYLLSQISSIILNMKKLELRTNPINYDFEGSLLESLLNLRTDLSHGLHEIAKEAVFKNVGRWTAITLLETNLNQQAYKIYDIAKEDLKEILFEVGGNVGSLHAITSKSETSSALAQLALCHGLKPPITFPEIIYSASSNLDELTEALSRKMLLNERERSTLGDPLLSDFEKLCLKLNVNPISLLLIFKENPELYFVKDQITKTVEGFIHILILRLLGYQWPKQVEAGESLLDWADGDGIIPLNEGLGETTLLGRMRKRFGADFGEEKEASIESEFANIVGKPLEWWLEEEFFTRHVKQFKNRPIAWHIVSDPSVVNHEAGQSVKGKKKSDRKKQKPAFSVIVHYHRFVDGDKGYGKLLLLKNKYLEKLMSQTRSELESLRGKGDDPKTFDRIAELDRKLVELEDFRERLERIQEGKDPESSIFVRWKGPDEQPQGWRPDINDGVKINIAPWERLGMFPVKKIVGKVEMATE